MCIHPLLGEMRGGVLLSQDLPAVATLMLDAYCTVPHDELFQVATECHGQFPYATGPTMCLKQLGMIQSERPWAGAAPLRAPVDGVYFVSHDPVRRLTALRDGLQALAIRPLGTALEFFRLQRDLNDLIVAEMHGVGHDYSAPYYSKKLLEKWARSKEIDWSCATVGDLRQVVADRAGGLGALPETMPLDILGAAFQIAPPMFPVMYCLAKQVDQSAATILAHKEYLQPSLDAFVLQYSFAPSPRVLVKMAMAQTQVGYEVTVRRRRPGWEQEVASLPQKRARRTEAEVEAEDSAEDKAKDEAEMRGGLLS